MEMTDREINKYYSQLSDDIIFTGVGVTENIIFNYYNMAGPPGGAMRTIFYTISRFVYDLIPDECKLIFEYEPLDRFLLLGGAQLAFTSYYTRNRLAILSDSLALAAIFLKDYLEE